jgi:hypothetical protein
MSTLGVRLLEDTPAERKSRVRELTRPIEISFWVRTALSGTPLPAKPDPYRI